MSFSVIHSINQLLGPDSVAAAEQNLPPVRLREDERHATHESPVPVSNVAELEVSSRATKRANPESPNNVQQLKEQPAADCRVGGSPSAPCLPSTGEISSATADFDAVVTSEMLLTPIFFNGTFNLEQSMAIGDAGTNLRGRFINFNAPDFLNAQCPQLLLPVVADACPDNAIPHNVSDFFANLQMSIRCPSALLEGEQFRWIKKFHLLSDYKKNLFWESNDKLTGNDVYMNKFLLRPLKELTTDDLDRVYKMFVGLSKDEQELMMQLSKASMKYLDDVAVAKSNVMADDDAEFNVMADDDAERNVVMTDVEDDKKMSANNNDYVNTMVSSIDALSPLQRKVLAHGNESYRYPRRKKEKRNTVVDASLDADAVAPENIVQDEDIEDDENIAEYAYDLVTNHPALKIRLKKHKAMDVSAEEIEDVVNSVREYVRRLSRLPSCYNRDAKYFSTCTCIKGLEDEIINSLGERIVNFFRLPKDHRDTILKERVKAANDLRLQHDYNLNNLMYRATAAENVAHFYRIDVGTDFVDRPVCLTAFRNLLGIFRRPWERLKSTSAYGNYTPGPIQHGNARTHHRSTTCNQRSAEPSICQYLQELADVYADPYATRFIRERTSVGLRNEEKGIVELPASMSKRSIYSGWCYSQGYKAKANAKGSFGSVTDYELRSYDDVLWPEGSESVICSWSSFLKIWRKHFSHLKIRNACEDVCGECVRLRNSFVHLKRMAAKKQRDEKAAENNWRSSEDDGDDSNDDVDSEDNSDNNELIAGINEQEFPEEYLWFRANQHAVQAQAQRVLAQTREEEAKATSSLPHEQRSYCLVADYCQNLSLPHFGSEQPGDTYYFSPLFVYVFGVADVSGEKAKLKAYGYHEGEGSKGGNNVASLLMQALRDLGWLIDGRCGGRLSIVMDNCGGQNKNKMVLRLALYLVERKFFNKVEFIFYLRGHTKNVCDRLFNLLKLRYHRSNVYTMEMLVEVLNMMDDISFTHVPSDVFYNFDKMLDIFYKNFKPGTIQKNHYFVVDSSEPTTMLSKLFIDDTSTDRYNHRKAVKERDFDLSHFTLERLNAPGIREIKQVELWKNWSQFVPHPHKQIICPKPPQDIIDKIRKEKSAKQKVATKKRKTGTR